MGALLYGTGLGPWVSNMHDIQVSLFGACGARARRGQTPTLHSANPRAPPPTPAPGVSHAGSELQLLKQAISPGARPPRAARGARRRENITPADATPQRAAARGRRPQQEAANGATTQPKQSDSAMVSRAACCVAPKYLAFSTKLLGVLHTSSWPHTRLEGRAE